MTIAPASHHQQHHPSWSTLPLPASTRLVLRSVSLSRRLKIYSLPPGYTSNPRHVSKDPNLSPVLTAVFNSWNRDVTVYEGDRNPKKAAEEKEGAMRKFFGKMRIGKKDEEDEGREEEDAESLEEGRLLAGKMESWTMKSRFDFGPAARALLHAQDQHQSHSAAVGDAPPSYQASVIPSSALTHAEEDEGDLSEDEKTHRLSAPAPTSYPVDEKRPIDDDDGADDESDEDDDGAPKPNPSLAARRSHRSAGLRRLAAVRGLVLNDKEGALALDEESVVDGSDPKGKGKEKKGKKRWFAKVKVKDLETDLFMCFDIRKRQWSCDRAFWVGEQGPFLWHQSPLGHLTLTDESGAELASYRRDSWEYRIQGILTLNFAAEKPDSRLLALACVVTTAIMHRVESQRRSNSATTSSSAATTAVVVS